MGVAGHVGVAGHWGALNGPSFVNENRSSSLPANAPLRFINQVSAARSSASVGGLRPKFGGFEGVLEENGRTSDVDLSPIRSFDAAPAPDLRSLIARETALETREAALQAREAALHDEIAHLSRMNLMGELAAGLAHELNQPLAATVNFLGAADMLLRKGAESALIHDMLGQASSQSLRAGEIIRRLRSFVDRRDPETRAELVEAVVRDAAALAMTGHERSGVRLACTFDPAARLMLAGRIQIEQVLVNVLRNGIEALANAPGESKEISVTTGVVDSRSLKIIVCDTGPGFPDHVLSRFCAPFVSTKGAGGMGVGLSLSRRIVEAHGGEMFAGNLSPAGACVRFTLPMVTISELRQA